MSYERSHQVAIITRFLDREKAVELSRQPPRSTIMALREEGRKYLTCLAMALKDPARHSEHEWRVLIIEPEGGNRFTRLKRDDGVHYIELPICAAGAVNEIVLGPRCSADPAKLRCQLDDAGLNSVSIRRSMCHCKLDDTQ